MAEYKERYILGYPKQINYECTKKILEQMEKNICCIYQGEKQGTGFFCKIPFPDENNMLPVLITNNHIINEIALKKGVKITIKIKEEKEFRNIYLEGRIKYTDEEYDITIIEIKEGDGIKNFLELDDIIINDIIKKDNNYNNNKYIFKTMYIIQYSESKLSVSYGVINTILKEKKYNFLHKCLTGKGASGSPILNLDNKVVGIHIGVQLDKEGSNYGLFLSFAIKAFLYKNGFTPGENKDNNIYSIKYNKKENENSLVEFSKKYNLNSKLVELNLCGKNIGNEGLKTLSNYKMEELKRLYLQNNDISDIKCLEEAKFEKLEFLDLGNNEFSDINILQKTNFIRLKELYLFDNRLSDINVFENVPFKRLEILNIGNNKVSDIKVLENVTFKGLKQLYLYGNIISDLNPLITDNLSKLEILNLGDNHISDISIFKNTKFRELKELFLYGNHISDIEVLANLNFDGLEKLDLGRNIISDINVLEKVNLKELKQLFLYNNKISDIKVIDRINLENLELINLRNNNGIIKGSMSYRFIIEI